MNNLKLKTQPRWIRQKLGDFLAEGVENHMIARALQDGAKDWLIYTNEDYTAQIYKYKKDRKWEIRNGNPDCTWNSLKGAKDDIESR